MVTVRDPATGVIALVVRCRSCNAPIYWGRTTAGKCCPYDVDEHGEPTRTVALQELPRCQPMDEEARLMRNGIYLHESFRHRRRIRISSVVLFTLAILLAIASLAIGFAPAAAAEPDEKVIAAADQAGVDPVLLEGALLSVGEPDPVRYLRFAGHLPWPVQPTLSTVWDRLAQCESNGRWHIDAYHDGGLQFLPSTWLAYGGGQYARYAWQATREQQIDIAIKVQRAAGWSQWPACSRRLGLR